MDSMMDAAKTVDADEVFYMVILKDNYDRDSVPDMILHEDMHKNKLPDNMSLRDALMYAEEYNNAHDEYSPWYAKAVPTTYKLYVPDYMSMY